MSDWNKKEVMKTDLHLQLNRNVTNAELYIETKGPGIRFEISDDTVAIFDGDEMYAIPGDSAISPFTLKT